MNIDYSKITDNLRVIKLLKQRMEIENRIKAIDETALIKHEIELLALPDVVKPFYCKTKRCDKTKTKQCDECALQQLNDMQ